MEIDLKKFEEEIVRKGAHACLPCNLSDDWLYLLNDIYESVFGGSEEVTLAAPLLAIMQIMSFKLKKSDFSIEGKQMKKLIEDYRIELAFEVVSRQTELEANRADLQTIFTNRNVQFKQK